MERVESDTGGEQPAEQAEEQFEDLEVPDEATLDVQGGFNPQPDPPGMR
jgi:hypothetical protein